MTTPGPEMPSAPIHPTVLEVLNTPNAPLLDQPAQQVLAAMGVPALPDLSALAPAPGMPPLPPLDLTTLMKPITDLFSGFGTGVLGGAGNPQAALQGVGQALATASQFAGQGLQLLQSMQGAGTQAATASGMAAQGTSAAVSTQAGHMHATLGAASTSVATGAAQTAAVAARFAATAAMLGPALVTPAGQVALLTHAVESGTEAMAITAHTKSQLSMHSATMAQAGQRIPVGGLAGAGTSAQSPVQQALSELTPMAALAQPLLTGASNPGIDPALSASAISAAGSRSDLSVPPMPMAAALQPTAAAYPTQSAGAVSTRAPLGAWQAQTVTAASAAGVGAPSNSGPVGAEKPPVPLLPAAGLAASGQRSTAGASPALITARHRDELVEEPRDVAAPVIGAAVSGTTVAGTSNGASASAESTFAL